MCVGGIARSVWDRRPPGIFVLSTHRAVRIARREVFLVRMTLVPATRRPARSYAWALPRWLDRLLPDLDIEGAKLQGATAPDLSISR